MPEPRGAGPATRSDRRSRVRPVANSRSPTRLINEGLRARPRNPSGPERAPLTGVVWPGTIGVPPPGPTRGLRDRRGVRTLRALEWRREGTRVSMVPRRMAGTVTVAALVILLILLAYSCATGPFRRGACPPDAGGPGAGPIRKGGANGGPLPMRRAGRLPTRGPESPRQRPRMPGRGGLPSGGAELLRGFLPRVLREHPMHRPGLFWREMRLSGATRTGTAALTACAETLVCASEQALGPAGGVRPAICGNGRCYAPMGPSAVVPPPEPGTSTDLETLACLVQGRRPNT